MRFHRLEFGGIGPFAGSHTIDFSDLAASGLFLLEGPTGAGKSTLIDALVFALYGSVGEAGAYDRLRSDYARAEDESFVDLVYEVGGGIYRIRRTPHYERPRRRGEGVTLKQSTARLWRLASPDAQVGEVVATKVEEASAEVLRGVGLSREQFTQTVILPQGQFAAFLKADNEQRRTLLQRIFGSELYQRLTEQLRTRRAAAEAALQRLANDLRMAVAALARVADLPQETADNLSDAADAAAQEGQDSPLVELSNQVRSAVEARSGKLAAASDQAGDLARRLKAEADRAGAAAEAAAAKRRLSLRLADLESDRPRRLEIERRLAEARRAGPMAGLLDSAADAARELDQARAEAAAAGLAEGSADESSCQAALEEAQSRERREADRLAAARALAQATLAHQSAAERLDGLKAELTRAAEAQANAARAVEREAQAGPQARAEVSRLEGLAQAVAEHGRAAKACQAAETALDQAKHAYTESQATELRLRNSRLAGMAGEMAGELAPGEPCPVCGSREHPAPAELAADHITRRQVEDAEARRAKAAAAVEAAAGRVTEAKTELARLEGLGGGGDAAEVAAQLTQAREALTQLGDRDRLGAALEAAESALAKARERQAQAEAAAGAAHDQVVKAQAVADGADVPGAAAALAAASEQVALARGRLRAAGAVARAEALAESSAASARRALAEAGFADAEAARAVQLSAAEMEARQAELVKSAAEEASLRERLAEPTLAQVDGDPAVLAQAAATASAEAGRAAEAAAEALRLATLAGRQAQMTAEAARETRAAAEALTKAKREAAALIRVANLANAGDANLRNVDLPTYVLIRRFEEVIDAANSRLGPMSDGRYRLERSETKEATRSRRTGLALRVMDNLTGQARDPRTLSGGETFYVSLALALGLADVVTAEAGGISLETLFVDEGFGSLSDEALEAVLAQLHRIRAGGRVVGVVSHVEALKQAIPDRIEVRRLPGGGSNIQVR